MTKTSDDYERFTQKVMTSFVGVEVHHHRTYVGRVSRREIIVDVSFNCTIAGANLLFIVECKHYKNSVSVDEVEEFHSKLDDIGAHKGIMVTTVGYQDGAIKVAEGRGIALALLTTECQPGEMQYVALAAGRSSGPSRYSSEFWQGNLRGPLGRYQGGFRFEGGGQFLGALFLDVYEEEKLKGVARWEKEHGTQTTTPDRESGDSLTAKEGSDPEDDSVKNDY